MIITVSGGREKQRSLVESIVSHMADRILGSRLSNAVYCHFQIISNLDADGWCEWMVHVRQMARSELYEIYRPRQMQVWKGKRLKRSIPYSKQPWEREAYRLQEPYAREYVERSGIRFVGKTWKLR